jgi:uncharacterized protein YndB with AHSA1/START domain
MSTLTNLRFTTTINAPKEKVWKTLWSDDTYRQWTKPFDPGSHAKSDWKKGSEVFFLTAENNGMFSVIHDMVPNELMVFKHLGMIEKGVKQPSSEKTKEWEGSFESYRLSENNGVTELIAEVETFPSFESFMNEKFPEALAIVKRVLEG